MCSPAHRDPSDNRALGDGIHKAQISRTQAQQLLLLDTHGQHLAVWRLLRTLDRAPPIADGGHQLRDASPHILVTGGAASCVQHLGKRSQSGRRFARDGADVDWQSRQGASSNVVRVADTTAPSTGHRFRVCASIASNRGDRFLVQAAGTGDAAGNEVLLESFPSADRRCF